MRFVDETISYLRDMLWPYPRNGPAIPTPCWRLSPDEFMGGDCGPDEPGSDQGWHDAIDRIGRLVDQVARSSRWVGTDKERRKSGPKSP